MHREPECVISYCISSNNSRSNYFFFVSKGGDYLREGDYLKYCSLEVLPWISQVPWSSVPNLVPWLIFRAWIVTDQFCWLIPLQLDRQGIKEREGCGGQLRYAREAIKRGMLLEEIQYIIIHWNFPVFLSHFGRDFNQIEDGLGFKYSVHESCLAWDSCFSTASIIIDY